MLGAYGHGIDLPPVLEEHEGELVEVPCCLGSAVYGPGRCTCWTEEYDREQQYGPQSHEEPKERRRMCDDCAFRDGSPEKRGDSRFANSEPGELEDLVHGDADFACHKGMRKLVALRHPSGMRVLAGPGAYEPAIVERYVHRPGDDFSHVRAVALKADGTPADLCAGLRAARARIKREKAEGQ